MVNIIPLKKTIAISAHNVNSSNTFLQGYMIYKIYRN